ncbi:MAG: ETEC_3214 domain-containing protein [Parashewanella sp.]
MENQTSNVSIKSNIWNKLQSISITVVAIMLSLGQWNDTQVAVTAAYETFITNWTNKVEYQQLEKINVGQTLEYAKSYLGVPHAIKRSKVDNDITFFYYGTKKYQLCLIVKQQRISGYNVVAITPDFLLPIPFRNETLYAKSISASYPQVETYFTDANNLDFYAESHELGKSAMFYNLVIGAANYGQFESSQVKALKTLNAELDRGVATANSLTSARQLIPNYFSVSELSPSLSVEGLLTHFEYKTLLK